MSRKTLPHLKQMTHFLQVYKKGPILYVKYNSDFTFANVEGKWMKEIKKPMNQVDYAPVSVAVSYHLNFTVSLCDSIPIY